MNNQLYHHGILGMKWGVRRYQNKDGSLTNAGKNRYRSTSIKSAMARRSNEKVDKGFRDWKTNAQKRDNAIELGKKRNAAKLAYEKNSKDKNLKKDYKQSNKEYKKALKENTTYRKGVVRQEVGRDISRKYLSEAKKTQKLLNADPKNRALKKEYRDYMNKHDVERAKARRATEVSSRRSQKLANFKRKRTLALKGAAATATIAAGTYATNKYLQKTGRQGINAEQVARWADNARKAMKYRGYFY